MRTPAQLKELTIDAWSAHVDSCARCQAWYNLPADPRIGRCLIELRLSQRIDQLREQATAYADGQRRVEQRERDRQDRIRWRRWRAGR